ncbi:uncharacterized protein LOC105929656 [Fundulus heteroclitus]|uniref:uncharacterized protein LOC105929656 n=1 Tax=Fundulus heteroclitus TaxID=8078 RepID=UPI00165CD3B4|nr:uncharacterized protein LOC105929656 [Fundulus heteroclitus]
MAAGFMILSILLFCLLNEVTGASGLPAVNPGYKAWQDGGPKLDVHGYRRPLHYVRSLRQPNINPEHFNPFNAWQNPQRGFVKGVSPRQNLRQVSHLWPERSPIQPAPHRNYPLVRPRGFKVSLDLPFLEQSQSKVADSTIGYRPNDPKLKTMSNVQFQNGLSIPKIQSPEEDSKKEPFVGKNTQAVPSSGFNVNIAISPAESIKPLIADHIESLGNVFQTGYTEPEKQWSSTQTGLKWPTISQTASKPTREQLGSTWSDTGPKQPPQQPYETIYKQPTHEKPTFSTLSNQHKTPQQMNQEKLPTRQSVRLEMPDPAKPLSPPVIQQLDRLDFHRPQTSVTRKDDETVQSHSRPQQYVSPLRHKWESLSHKYVGAGSPSGGQTQSSRSTSGADGFKDLTNNQKGEKDKEATVPRLQLDITFPLNNLLSNFTKGEGGYLNINPQSVGSLFKHYMEAKKLPSNTLQTGLNQLVSEFDSRRQMTGHPERKWPILNLDVGPQQKKQPYVPVPTKPIDHKLNFSSWFPSQKISQEETASTLSWGPQKPKIENPQFPVLAISKYLVDIARPSESDKAKIIQQIPSLSERFQSLYSSLQPGTSSYVQGQRKPSVHPLSASTYDSSPFEPSSDFQQNTEKTDSGSSHLSFNYGLSPINSPKLETVPAKRPQTWQKPLSSYYQHPYNSGREASYGTNFETEPVLHIKPSGYETQKLPVQDSYRYNQDGKRKLADLIATGGDATFGQTSRGKGNGKNTAGKPFNVQPMCGPSSSELSHQGYFTDLLYPNQNAKPQPCSQMPCMGREGNCLKEPKKESSNLPLRVNYSPKAETTSISVPYSTFEQVFSQSMNQPRHNGFRLQQYPVGQGHPQQPTRFK